jgi:hypothetical protein
LKSHLMNDGYQKHNPFYGRIQVHLHEKALWTELHHQI